MSTEQDSHPTIFGTFRTMSTTVQVLLWGTFVSNLTAFLNAFLVLFLINRGISPWYAGLALAALLVGRIVGTAVGGAAADRIGYRWTIIASTVASAVLVAAMVQVHQAWLAIVVSALTGVVSQTYRPASQAWMIELTPQKSHVMLFSIYRLAFNVGSTVGPLVAALLVKYSYSLLFYCDAGASLAFGVLAFALLPNDRPARAEAAADTAAEKAQNGYRQVLRDGRFVLVGLGLFLTAVAYIQGTAALPLFISGTGHPAQVYALMLSLNGAMVIALEVVLTKWTQRLAILYPMVIGMALLGVGHFLYLVPFGIVALSVATVVWTLGEIVAAPSMLAYPGRVAPPELRARYVAAATIPTQAGYAIGPMVGVAAWQLWGRGVWMVTGAIGLVAALVTLMGAKPLPQQAAPQEPAEPDVPVVAEPIGPASEPTDTTESVNT
jgi:MFS family permease